MFFINILTRFKNNAYMISFLEQQEIPIKLCKINLKDDFFLKFYLEIEGFQCLFY